MSWDADLIRGRLAFALMSPKGSSSRLPFLSRCQRSSNNRTDNIDNNNELIDILNIVW